MRDLPWELRSMAALGKRFPRDVFTKKLRRICERLDECATQTISFKHFLFRRELITTTVTVKSLWVAGSYARGAPDCGDLDLILQAEPPGNLPPQPTLTKAFFGTLPYVSYYLGNPSNNQSGIEFPDAIQIWDGPARGWRDAIDAIKEDPAAGRYVRKHDGIPLRREQVYVEIDDIDEVIELRDQGILEWEFVEITDALLAPIPQSEIRGEEYLFRCWTMWGKAAQRLLPGALRLMREREPQGTWRDFDRTRSFIKCGGTALYLGRPRLPVHRLDGDPSIRQLALAPHISKKGPNGFWLIRRGPKHPDHLALVGRHAFHHVNGGAPSIVHVHGDQRTVALLIELFTTEAEAKSEADAWNDDADDLKLEVGLAEGNELLGLFGLCDVVSIDGAQIPVTWTGCLFTAEEKGAPVQEETAANISALAEALPLARRATSLSRSLVKTSR